MDAMDVMIKKLIVKLNKVLEDAMCYRKPICMMTACKDIDISLIELQIILDHLTDTDPVICKQATMEVDGNRVIFTWYYSNSPSKPGRQSNNDRQIQRT